MPLIGAAIIVTATVPGIKRLSLNKHTETANAVITDFIISAKTDVRHTIIRYTAEGHTYIKAIKKYSPEMSRGDIITIKYLPDKPDKPYYTEDNRLKNILWTAIGSAIAGIGIALTLLRKRDKRRKKELIDTGKRVDAVITDIRQDTKLSMKGMHPIIISCRYISADGRIYLFNSAPAWHRSYDINPRSKIPVYIDSSNPANYYVDVDSVAD